MRVLFDTNVVVDVLKDRAPFADVASALFDAVEARTLVGVLGATTITTLFYLLRKSEGRDVALQKLRILLQRFEVAPVGRGVIEGALSLGFSDFEDAVLHEAGRHVHAEAIVTRNARDFRSSVLPVYTPDELLRMISASEDRPS
jgi:predicted nucleic acid-binding protein